MSKETENFDNITLTDSELQGMHIPDDGATTESDPPASRNETDPKATTPDDGDDNSGDDDVSNPGDGDSGDTAGDDGAGEGDGDGTDDNNGENKGEDPEITVGDGTYRQSEIVEAMEDRKNKAEWQKSNTTKAQEVAERRKAVEPVLAVIDTLKNNTQLTENLKEALLEAGGESAVKALDDALTFDPEKNPHPDTILLNELTEKHNVLENEVAMSKEGAALKSKFNLTDKRIDAVVDFAVKRFNETGQALSLEDAYKLMKHDELEANPPTKEKPASATGKRKKAGAQKIDKQEVAASFEDITLDGFDLFSSD